MNICEWAGPQEGTNRKSRRPTTERDGNRYSFEPGNAADHSRLSFNAQQSRAVRLQQNRAVQRLRRKLRILRRHDRSVICPPKVCRRQVAWGCNPHGYERRMSDGLTILTADSMSLTPPADASMHIDLSLDHISTLYAVTMKITLFSKPWT